MSIWTNIESEIKGLLSGHTDQLAAVEVAIKAEVARIAAEAKIEAARVKSDVLTGVNEAVPIVKADLEAGLTALEQAIVKMLEKRL